MIKEGSKGITLIALVVTIIVLLILAGVSIAMLTGTTGILTQAQNAKKATEETSEQEKRQLSQIEASSHLKNYDYTDAEGNTAKIPAGFAVSNVEGENLVSKGLVIIGENGNEYVWIPCTTDEQDTSKVQYKRENEKWGIEDDNDTLATKDELTLAGLTPIKEGIENGITSTIWNEITQQVQNEILSVKNNGGYYIGRYEVGKEKDAAVVKPNQIPYTNISWNKAYEISKGISESAGATSYLCSSYAWDTAIRFIENNVKLATNYGESRENFNENWIDKEVKDKNGNIIKRANENIILKTGLTTAKNNIYDMGGNVSELTTEIIPDSKANEIVVFRGRSYTSNYPAGYRWDYYIYNEYFEYYGFRTTLILK